jgi:hypothetical protein
VITISCESDWLSRFVADPTRVDRLSDSRGADEATHPRGPWSVGQLRRAVLASRGAAMHQCTTRRLLPARHDVLVSEWRATSSATPALGSVDGVQFSVRGFESVGSRRML